MSVSLGNAWGNGASRNRRRSTCRASSSPTSRTATMFFRVQYQDLRSPLQYGYDRFGAPGRWAY